jgi:hypothetical protein
VGPLPGPGGAAAVHGLRGQAPATGHPRDQAPGQHHLEFTQTIGRLYYQHRDHKNIAEKKITYFLDHLRSHYYVQTGEFNDDLFDRLHAKTGQPLAEITALFNLIAHIRRQPAVSETQLLQLHRSIEKFASGTPAGDLAPGAGARKLIHSSPIYARVHHAD